MGGANGEGLDICSGRRLVLVGSSLVRVDECLRADVRRLAEFRDKACEMWYRL